MADNRDELLCPACGCFMKKVFIPEHGIMVDVCNEGCGGIWFDNREDLHFDERHESIDEILAELKNVKNIEIDQSRVRYCPVCTTKMVKNYSSVNHSVEIDECYNCGGKFYDGNELLEVRKEFATEGERLKALKEEFSRVFGAAISHQARELEDLRNSGIPIVGSINRQLSSAFINQDELDEDNKEEW